MTLPNGAKWTERLEADIERTIAYEDGLQQQIDDHVARDELFEAGLVAFEHSELLTKLRESPAARHVAEYAILLAQRDIELATIALDMITCELTEEPIMHILEAKQILNNALEQRGWAPREWVRNLGLAYVGDAPEALVDENIGYSRYTNGDLASRFLRKTWSRKATMSVGDDIVTVEHQTVKDFDDRLLLPGFEKKERLQIGDYLLYSVNGELTQRLGVDEHSEMDATPMAKRLLLLPDEPEYLDSTRILAPAVSPIKKRLAQLDEEEQRWLQLLDQRHPAPEMIQESLDAVRAERARIFS